jgi:endonuclease/exonuclease/phosphatase family metal-dependent hydrolase
MNVLVQPVNMVDALKGLGPVRLGKMSPDELHTLCVALGVDASDGDPIAQLLKLKRRTTTSRAAGARERAACMIQSAMRRRLCTSEPEPVVDTEPDSDATIAADATTIADATTTDATATTKTTFVKRHELKLMAFNSLKLRIQRQALENQWIALVAVMSTLDVILISEVPAGEALERTRALVNLISAQSKHDDDWFFALSEPSGPGNLEVHVCLVKSPVRILETATRHEAGGVALDHAPLSCTLLDPRFSTPTKIVVNSVHMPPSNRARDRDRQLNALLKTYASDASMRNQQPFTQRGAKDARRHPVIHVLGGDFNTYPGAVDGLDLMSIGYALPLVGSQVATSAGRRSYDHFLVDRHTSEAYSLSWEVLELAVPHNSSLGIMGLSDHDPILLSVRETRQVSHPPH